MKISGVTPNQARLVLLSLLLLFIAFKPKNSPKEEILNYLKSLGNGSYLFGQVATWVHNENPDMDDPSNWLNKVYKHTDLMPKYGVITYDFTDDPFSDEEWNRGVKKMWDKGLIPGVYNFFANPAGGNAFREVCDIDPIFDSGTNPTKTNFYSQMDRMAFLSFIHHLSSRTTTIQNGMQRMGGRMLLTYTDWFMIILRIPKVWIILFGLIIPANLMVHWKDFIPVMNTSIYWANPVTDRT